MQQLINFITKQRYLFLFIFIQFITLFITIQNKNYHRSKFINSTGNVIGKLYSSTNTIDKYVGLRKENQKLTEENAKLQSMLQSSMILVTSKLKKVSDTNHLKVIQKYNFVDAQIVNNSYRRRNNHITINKGIVNGITKGSGVVVDNGIIGIIESVGDNYSSIISVLNKNIRVNVSLKKSSYFGSLYWLGKDRTLFDLIDIPKEADVVVGDTVTTGGFSTIFPENINIGVVESASIEEGHNYYSIKIRTFIDYANIKNVYVIENLLKSEIKKVESSIKGNE